MENLCRSSYQSSLLLSDFAWIIYFVLFIVVFVATKQFRRWFKKSCYFCRNISFNSINTFDKKFVCELQLLTKFDKTFPLPHFQFFFRMVFVSTGKTWPSTDSIIFSCTVYKRKETHNKNTVLWISDKFCRF